MRGIRIAVCLLLIFSICVRLEILCEAKDRTELNISSVTMKSGTTRKLQLRHLTASQKKQVRWKSSKKTVVSVTKNGKIKAGKKGKAVISAVYKKKKYQCMVRVVAPNAKEYVTEGTTSYRGFTVDSVLHSAKNGNIHYNVYFPKSYDGNLNAHGKTLVYADGRFYVIITGFNEPKPRQYGIYEISGEALEALADENNFDLDYFRQ